MNRLSFFLVTVVLFTSSACSAKVLLPAVFSDHMVLQQKTTVAVWGWSEPGERISVSGSWNPTDTIKTRATNQGHWRIDLPTGEAGGPFTLSISGAGNAILLQDVLLGEVWICSGQSNMEFTVTWPGFVNKDSVTAQADFPGIRFFHIPRVGAAYPQQDCKANWEACTPVTMPRNTAIGYFFARELYRKLNVPVGIIESAWGGTPAEVWAREDQVKSNPDLLAHQYDDHSIGWPTKAGVLYNGMIAPIIPYGVAGALWYQGESNTYRPGSYAVLMDSLVTGWRRDFGQNFPFYYVQIAAYAYDSTKQKGYILREQQDMDQQLIPNVGMVVIGDLSGNIKDVHPKDKYDVALRLANYALSVTYHQSVGPYQSPSYHALRIDRHKAFLTFDHAENGLVSEGKLIPHFQIAGADQQFVDATAVIKGSTIEVSAPGVTAPVAVRYCYTNSAVPTVFSKDGHLPLAPFRTDQWKNDE
jgi:sialate O-acetylesterase